MDNLTETASKGLGDRIKSVRSATSQADFAVRLGTTKESVGRYERGERQPDAEFIHRLSQVLDVSPIWLLFGQGPMRLSEASTLLAEAPPAPGAHGWDQDLMRNCIIAADELLHELGREMDPAEKADAILKMYRSELDRKVAGQPGMSPAEVVRLFGRGA